MDPWGRGTKQLARYGQVYKRRVVARLLPPESTAVEGVSREVGVSVATLERWRAEALAEPAGEQVGADRSPLLAGKSFRNRVIWPDALAKSPCRDADFGRPCPRPRLPSRTLSV